MLLLMLRMLKSDPSPKPNTVAAAAVYKPN